MLGRAKTTEEDRLECDASSNGNEDCKVGENLLGQLFARRR